MRVHDFGCERRIEALIERRERGKAGRVHSMTRAIPRSWERDLNGVRWFRNSRFGFKLSDRTGALARAWRFRQRQRVPEPIKATAAAATVVAAATSAIRHPGSGSRMNGFQIGLRGSRKSASNLQQDYWTASRSGAATCRAIDEYESAPTLKTQLLTAEPDERRRLRKVRKGLLYTTFVPIIAPENNARYRDPPNGFFPD